MIYTANILSSDHSSDADGNGKGLWFTLECFASTSPCSSSLCMSGEFDRKKRALTNTTLIILFSILFTQLREMHTSMGLSSGGKGQGMEEGG